MTLLVEVGARLQLPAEALPVSLEAELRGLFTHSNPQFYRERTLGYRTSEPAEIETWREDHDEGGRVLSLPRGGLRRLRRALQDAGVDWDERDVLCDGDLSMRGYTGDYVRPQRFPLPAKIPWPHQQEVVRVLGERECGLILATMGCITGDAQIEINRGGAGKRISLAELVARYNGSVCRGRSWDLDVPTLVRARLDDGTVRLVRLVAAYESGVKPVYEVRTASGHSITATADHQVLTSRGWCRVGQLTLDDSVHVQLSSRPISKLGARKKKLKYAVRVLPQHPYASRDGAGAKRVGGYTVPLHRLVFEAALNGLELEAFVGRCKAGKLDGLVFLDPKKFAVHHVNEDHRDNALDNLAALTHRAHNKAHQRDAIEAIAVRTVPSRVVANEYVGERPTYDLSLEAPHNFLANGVVVHNSGKTFGGLFAAAAANLPAIVLVWERNLMEQWVADIGELFGIGPDDIGLVQGKKRKLRSITLAMQQTLNQMDPAERLELLSNFGFLLADEVQRASAKTYTATIDEAPCRFRVGMSGGVKRKDGKQFLVYDLFGDPALEVTRDEMIDAGVVHDVSALLSPTAFRADWYVRQVEAKRRPDFTRLVAEMSGDQDRNDQIAALVVERAAEPGRRGLVFTHRVEHARLLRQMLQARGVPCGLMLGGDDQRQEFAETKRDLKAGRLLVGVGTYAAMGVGQNLPAVEVAVATTPVHSNKEYLGQVTARVCRVTEGKVAAEAVVLWDRAVFGDRPLRNVARWYHRCDVLTAAGAMIPAAQYLRDQPASEVDDGEAERSAAGQAGIFTSAAGARRARAR